MVTAPRLAGGLEQDNPFLRFLCHDFVTEERMGRMFGYNKKHLSKRKVFEKLTAYLARLTADALHP